jgi:hypothetical protein
MRDAIRDPVRDATRAIQVMREPARQATRTEAA